MTGHAVDVLLPIRLPAPWLEETLNSLSSQTMPEWHLIAIVHGEPGDVPSLIRSIVPHATVLHAPPTATLSDVLNLGVGAATAPLIARIDADDVAEATRFEVQLAFMRQHSDVAVVCTPVTLIDEQGQVTGDIRGAGSSILRGLLWKNVIAHPSVMVRRAALAQVGGYNSQARHAEDYELWLRLAAAWQVAQLPVPLLRYRIHSAQVTRTRAIPASSRAVVGRARVALAKARGASVVAAHLRQFVWSTPQVVRSWRRGEA